MVSGFFMTLASSPMDNVKTRMMNQIPGERHYDGIQDCMKQIYRHEGGLKAFMGGFTGQWARFAPYITI